MLIRSALEILYCSEEGRRASIRLKEGEIGYSSFAAMSITVAPRANKLGTSLPWRKMMLR